MRYRFGRRTIATGTVTGDEDGLFDTGGPESGPGLLVETPVLIVATDYGRTIRVCPRDAEPDGDDRWAA